MNQIDSRFVGLDIETTGSGGPDEFKLIQIGVAIRDGPLFCQDVGWDPPWNETLEAQAVHGISPERIIAAPRSWQVDGMLISFLNTTIEGTVGRLVPVGWNVGSFDMPFVRAQLPQSAKRFGYRAVDLNSVCYTIAILIGIDPKALKKGAKVYSRFWITEEAPHNAGYDARAALYEWDYMMNKVRDYFA